MPFPQTKEEMNKLGQNSFYRLLHHSIIVNISGDSYRLKDRRKAGILPKTAKLVKE